jgi:hypothetical protein
MGDVSTPPSTPYDDMPIAARRACWGWFGEAWQSGICYTEDGRLIEEMRKPFPAGEKCLYCGELFDEAAGDSGQAMPFLGTSGPQIVHVHKECMLREALGPLAHLQRRCDCHGGAAGASGMTSRQDALAVWNWTLEHGVTEGR